MFKNIKLIYFILDKKEKISLIIFQFFLICSSILEFFSFASIVPFVTALTDKSSIYNNNLLNFFYNLLQPINYENFLIVLGLSSAFLILFSNIILIISTYITSFFSHRIGMAINFKLYKYYLHESYFFHHKNDSSSLSAKVINEANRIGEGIIPHILSINSRLLILCVIFFTLAWYNFLLTSIIMSIVLALYLFVYYFFKIFLKRIGTFISKFNIEWFRNIKESFSAIKELIVLDRLELFENKQKKLSKKIAKIRALNHIISFSPKYLIEGILLILIIIFTIYKINFSDNLIKYIPIISLLAISGYKLLPVFQQIYYNSSQIKVNASALELLRIDFEKIIKKKLKKNILPLNNYFFNNIFTNIKFKNISLKVENNFQNQTVLNDITLDIKINKINAIIGTSGSGKSSFVNICAGLIKPSGGKIYLNNSSFDNLINKSWQKLIGFVPQQIFITNTNILENVCLGLQANKIEINRASSCLISAGLKEFSSLDEFGLYRAVGEAGNKLSLGQIQRIGLARSLYTQPKILIFDEITSAFDAIIERDFYSTIENLSYKNMTIIIITHKVDYLKNSHIIHLFNNSNLIASGPYQSISKNKYFKDLSLIENYV